VFWASPHTAVGGANCANCPGFEENPAILLNSLRYALGIFRDILLLIPFDKYPSLMFLSCMQVIDLTENYLRDYIQNGNRQAYENSFPELFEHFYQFWTRRENDIAQVNSEDIQLRQNWINQLIEKLSRRLIDREYGLEAISLSYFIGVGTTNGHAFKWRNRYCVWLPLETYTSTELVNVFVTHEIVHALHYQHSPAFYFDSRKEKLQISRQLITEGLATYITLKLLGISDLQALWADYLSESDARKWQRACEAEENNLYRLIGERYYESDQDIGIFNAADPKDIYRFRSGYYAGLKLIENYANKNNLTLNNLLQLPRGQFEKDIFELIQSQY